MSGLLFLTHEDFYIGKGTKGNILCNSIKGLSLVFFYSTKCHICQAFIPSYKKLPGNVKGCHFSMVNVSQYQKIVGMSNNTITPIQYVPYIVLYVNGKPYIKYEGEYDTREIAEFIMEVSNTLSQKEKFFSNNDKVKMGESGIAIYSDGTPITDRICYLNFEEAYN
jgi:thioredoxin-like negative regulator of GroEL